MAGEIIKAHFKLNRAGFFTGLQQLGAVSTRLPGELLNKALMSTAIRARREMPVVTPSKISAELAEYKVPVQSYSRKGKLLGKGKARASFFDATGASKGRPVPLLALIINARVLRVDNAARSQPGLSTFNRRTGMVFARESSPFRGVPRAVGAQRMLAAMRRIHSARRSSSGFYKTCAAAIMFMFKAALGTMRNPGALGESGAGSGSISQRIGRIAGGSPAKPGAKATASFWVADTEPSSKGGTQALQRVAQPVWQRSLDAEASSMKAEAARRYAEAFRKAGFQVK